MRSLKAVLSPVAAELLPMLDTSTPLMLKWNVLSLIPTACRKFPLILFQVVGATGSSSLNQNRGRRRMRLDQWRLEMRVLQKFLPGRKPQILSKHVRHGEPEHSDRFGKAAVTLGPGGAYNVKSRGGKAKCFALSI